MMDDGAWRKKSVEDKFQLTIRLCEQVKRENT